MNNHEAFAETPDNHARVRDTRRLTEAAGPAGEPTREALAEVAHACGPNTIDALATLLRRVRMAAPERVGRCATVAFIRYGHAEGMQAVRGAAITADEAGRYNVHTVFWDERTARWEAQNGRYGVSWAVALGELVGRAETDAQP
jgi:hypothetical protein